MVVLYRELSFIGVIVFLALIDVDNMDRFVCILISWNDVPCVYNICDNEGSALTVPVIYFE